MSVKYDFPQQHASHNNTTVISRRLLQVTKIFNRQTHLKKFMLLVYRSYIVFFVRSAFTLVLNRFCTDAAPCFYFIKVFGTEKGALWVSFDIDGQEVKDFVPLIKMYVALHTFFFVATKMYIEKGFSK